MSGNIEAHDYREPGELQNIGSPESKLKLHLPAYLQGFLMDIDRMNRMYRMPEVENRLDHYLVRLKQFQDIIKEECDEILEIDFSTTDNAKALLDVRTQLADLLGDIIVFCASEAQRWDIPIDRVLSIIMQSNFSKLDANGQPIYDERMKLMKGPNYWKPEPEIEAMLIDWNKRSA